MGFKITLNFIV